MYWTRSQCVLRGKIIQRLTEGDMIKDPTEEDEGLPLGFIQGLFRVKKIRTDVHHFKDNKNGDASIPFFSKYDSKW